MFSFLSIWFCAWMPWAYLAPQIYVFMKLLFCNYIQHWIGFVLFLTSSEHSPYSCHLKLLHMNMRGIGARLLSVMTCL